MAKEISALIKLQVRGGAANPSPPVGPALGAKGVNIWSSVSNLMQELKIRQVRVLPVVITVYGDKSFDFIVKTPPVAIQLKEAAKIKSGAAEPNRIKSGTVTKAQVQAIAEDKMVDLNCFTVESAMNMVAGTARSMGIAIK